MNSKKPKHPKGCRAKDSNLAPDDGKLNKRKEVEQMTRKRMRHKLLEMSRRVYLNYHGTLKGFGKVSRFYDGTWKIDFNKFPTCTSYKDIWNREEMLYLRKSVGM